jgi:hypothetical protein
VRKIPVRYFFAISLLLAVGGCGEGGGPPPSMELNTDPQYDGPATDVVPVVGDLGGFASNDVWVGSGSFDSPSTTFLDRAFITFAGFTLLGNDSPDNPPLTFTLGGSTDNPPPTLILEDTDVVPVIGDLGGPVTDYFGGTGSTNGPSDSTDGASNWLILAFDQIAQDFNLFDQIMVPFSKITFSQDQLDFVHRNIVVDENPYALLGFRESMSRFLNLVIATTPITPLAFPRQDGVPTSMLPGDRPFGGGMYERPGTNVDGGPKADIAHPATQDSGPKTTGPTAVSNTDRKEEFKQQLLANPSGATGLHQQPLDDASKTSVLDSNRKQEFKEHLLGDNKDASALGSDHKQGLLEGSKGNSFNAKNSLEEKSFKNSVGEKTRSTFTGDKVLSQRGTTNSFAPLVGKTHTFSGTGTKPPTSGKSFKMHGF